VTATLPQLAAFGLLAGMMLLFVWGRIRYDMVAVLALLAALALGLVKPEDAFSGFADDIVIIVASALVISAAVAAPESSRRRSAESRRASAAWARSSSSSSARSPSCRRSSRISARSPC
jgi:peptidoglycan/LPS O-acetylase OafA/YrhL